MKNHGLPYGMKYLTMLQNVEDKAERMYGKPKGTIKKINHGNKKQEAPKKNNCLSK